MLTKGKLFWAIFTPCLSKKKLHTIFQHLKLQKKISRKIQLDWSMNLYTCMTKIEVSKLKNVAKIWGWIPRIFSSLTSFASAQVRINISIVNTHLLVLSYLSSSTTAQNKSEDDNIASKTTSWKCLMTELRGDGWSELKGFSAQTFSWNSSLSLLLRQSIFVR